MASKKVTVGVNPVGLMSSGTGLGSSSGIGSGVNVNATASATSTNSSATTSSAGTGAINSPNNSASASVVQEFSVRVPKPDKPMSVMRFNGALNVDIAKWTQLKMLRDDHSTKRAAPEPSFYEQPDMPKFGAGSEFGREAREEARRRKYGQHKKKVNVEDQPWVLKAVSADKQTKRFKGLREGTISENASYFIFTQATDGQFEVFPVSQWYNFTPIQTYKALSAEEAEEEFGRRDKIMNYFSVMVRKRMKGDEAEGADKDEEKPGKKKGGGGSGGLKVSEMEDWDDVNEMESDDDDEEGAEGKEKTKKKKGADKKKKKKKGSDSEANEDSDDGDGEGRELDYISDSSISSSDDDEGTKKVELGGVDQETGLRNLLESDSSEEENPEEKKKEEEQEKEEGEKPKKKKGKKAKAKKPTDSSSPVENLSDDSDDDDVDGGGGGGSGPSSSSVGGSGPGSGSGSGSTLASGSGINNDSDSSSKSSVVEKEKTPDEIEDGDSRKRKLGAKASASGGHSAKKAKMEVSSALLQTAASEGITEEAVRRYLLRKPMTVTELLQKFKSKKTKVSSEDMVTIIASILKKINPMKRTQSTKMYLYLKN